MWLAWPRSWLRRTRTTSPASRCLSMADCSGRMRSSDCQGHVRRIEICMKNNVRLVIADVDGTLVTQEKVLTARAVDAVKRLKNAGIAFSITSGRPPLGMKMLIDLLGLTEPIAAFNGGVFVHPDLSVMAQSFVPPDTAAKVIEAIERHRLDC